MRGCAHARVADWDWRISNATRHAAQRGKVKEKASRINVRKRDAVFNNRRERGYRL
jgi:hypothetical protein